MGLDVWIEASSGNEPGAHLSLGIGEPSGNYKTYSFALTPNCLGCVYEDITKGGQILKLLKATKKQDKLIENELLQMAVEDNKKYYGYEQTCIGYTNDKFNYFKNTYNLNQVNFIERKKVPRGLKGYIGLSTSSSTVGYQRSLK